VWWQVAVVVLGGVLLLGLGLVAALYLVGRRQGTPVGYKEVLRLVPDVVRLVRRLASDPTLPRGVRLRLALLLVYLVFPLDLVPDFIPVIGYADDAIVVALILRSVTRAAGTEALDRHWPGTPEGLGAVKRLAGVAT
jgi:uncharacterized membrane protein YkvA (DUF1232 family)